MLTPQIAPAFGFCGAGAPDMTVHTPSEKDQLVQFG
jgi:hypothetical protein